MRARLFPYLLLAPYLFFFVLFLGYPIVRGVYMSFWDWGIFGPIEFQGLKTYTDLLQHREFLQSLNNTLFFTVLFVAPVVVISLCLAVLLNGEIPGMGLFRTIFFLPIVVNVATATIAIDWILDPATGILNRILEGLSLPTQAWLSQPGWAMMAVSMVVIWMSAGLYTIIYMAGLSNIPTEYYEAVMIDGGNGWHQLRYITVPLLRPVTLLVVILALIQAFQVFGEVYLLTGGGPFGSTKVLTYLLYQEGFTNFRFGSAAAIGVVMTLMIAAISYVQFRIFGEGKDS